MKKKEKKDRNYKLYMEASIAIYIVSLIYSYGVYTYIIPMNSTSLLLLPVLAAALLAALISFAGSIILMGLLMFALLACLMVAFRK